MEQGAGGREQEGAAAEPPLEKGEGRKEKESEGARAAAEPLENGEGRREKEADGVDGPLPLEEAESVQLEKDSEGVRVRDVEAAKFFPAPCSLLPAPIHRSLPPAPSRPSAVSFVVVKISIRVLLLQPVPFPFPSTSFSFLPSPFSN